MLFALTDSPGKAILALVAYIVVQQLESNVTIPVVMAQRVRMHPALIAIGVVVVGQLFGFVGLFVAVPILSLLAICVEEFWVKPIDEAEAERRRVEIDPGRAERARAGGEEAAQASFVIAITTPIARRHDQHLNDDPEARELHAAYSISA